MSTLCVVSKKIAPGPFSYHYLAYPPCVLLGAHRLHLAATALLMLTLVTNWVGRRIPTSFATLAAVPYYACRALAHAGQQRQAMSRHEARTKNVDMYRRRQILCWAFHCSLK